MHIQRNISLKNYNSFGIDVSAEYFAVFNSLNEIAELLETNTFNTQHSTLKTTILGGGSNILFTKDVTGMVLKNEITGIEKVKEDDEHVYLKAGAGENWHQLVLYCLDNNYAGIENLALIPGNVGASPMQNIGAYGAEIKDVFHSLDAFDLYERKIVSFSNADCEFGYRESVFKNKFKGRFIISSVIYKLNKKPAYNISYGAITQELDEMNIHELSIQSIALTVMRIRNSKLPDPKIIGNAGSFFKNPEVEKTVFEKLQEKFPGIVGHAMVNGNIKLAAGWLIEQCGWKGYRKGDAGCHAKQALVLVNFGHAAGKEIYELSSEILDTVYKKFGVQLEREVNIL